MIGTLINKNIIYTENQLITRFETNTRGLIISKSLVRAQVGPPKTP